jgi:hypothetical protein
VVAESGSVAVGSAAAGNAPAANAVPDGVADAYRFRTIGELAERCGHYCWVEEALFALLGDRACRGEAAGSGRAVVPEVRVVLSEMAVRRALLASQWRDRLPVRAGVDADALVVPPPGSLAVGIDLLVAEPDPHLILAGVVGQLLPRVLGAYRAHRTEASPVSEAPVRAVLEGAIRTTASDRAEGRLLLERVAEGGEGARELAEFTRRLERALEGEKGVFPAARAS